MYNEREDSLFGGCAFFWKDELLADDLGLKTSKVQRDSLYGNFGDWSKVKGAGNCPRPQELRLSEEQILLKGV